MKRRLAVTALSFLLGAGATAAQENGTPSATATGRDAVQPGQAYTLESSGDWTIRCLKQPDGADPCQLYQLMKDANGASVSEIILFPLPPGQGPVAGATLAVPLETLLTQQVSIQIDDGQVLRYPFSFCNRTGCFARIGLTADDLAAYKKGATAKVTIVPLATPDQPVVVTMSLRGFTAAFDKLASQAPASNGN